MVRRASMELGLEGTLSIMERRPSQETPSKSKSAPARSRVTPARKPSLTRRSSEIRKDLLPPGIVGDVVGAMLGCVAAVQKCMPSWFERCLPSVTCTHPSASDDEVYAQVAAAVAAR